MNKQDRRLGMDRRITRRDFLNGVAITVGGSLLASCTKKEVIAPEFAPESASDYYPPALAGLRGNHEGSYEVFHSLRDGDFWDMAGAAADTGETYDLVIVGAGISGLSSAYFFRKQAGPHASVLILDNHDDFGGHAKRNEFRIGERTILGYGGTFSIDSPAPYSAVAKGFITELGIDVSRWEEVVDYQVYLARGLKPSVFFDQETFGSDRLLHFPASEFRMGEDFEASVFMKKDFWKQFNAVAPIAEAAKLDIQRLSTKETDYMAGLTSDEKKAKLARMSYADFLTQVAKAHPDVVKFLQARLHGLYGVGIEAVPAQDAWGLGLPGFQGMGLDPSFGPGMNHDAMRYPEGGDAYFFHFPDGGASLTRLLVRRLVPSAIPGSTVDDIVTARCNYAQLDTSSSPTRIRLNSTVVGVKHLGSPDSAKEVEVAYVRGEKLRTVRARRCILACWSTVIPYLCPELPPSQKEDLAYEVKVPLLYTNVLLSNWQSFVNAGVHTIHSPGGYHSMVSLDLPVSVGKYNCSRSPEEPVVIHMMRTPCSPGLPARQQHQAGRLELLTTKFETVEHNIRDQLARMLGPWGLDPARDIRAITVNRWAHGYAYQYNSLFDSFWLEGKETPCERARKPFGRMAIANADTAAYSYLDAAIDQAHRAVNEVRNLS